MKSFTAGVILFVLFFSPLTFVWPAAGHWNLQTVDWGGQTVGSHNSLALDDQDRPHISYYDSTNGNLKYAVYDGSSWNIQTIDWEGNVGEYTSLALDSSGSSHISYYDLDNRNLKYARRDGSGWTVQTVDWEGEVGRSSSLALDSSGYPHISYECEPYYLKYAFWDGSQWEIKALDWNEQSRGGHPSLALDNQDLPHIAYNGGRESWYAYNDGSSWRVEMLMDCCGCSVGMYPSLTLDSSDDPHIIFGDSDGEGWYAARDDSQWDIKGLPICGWGTSLALDVQDRPHVSHPDYHFIGGSKFYLGYAYEDGSGWHNLIVDSGVEDVWYTSLALDSSGNPYISYYSADNGNLKYARWVPAPLRPMVDSGDYDGDGTSDIAVFQSSSGLWSVRDLTQWNFGSSDDLPVPGDYDGDATTDLALFQPSSGLWAIRGLPGYISVLPPIPPSPETTLGTVLAG